MIRDQTSGPSLDSRLVVLLLIIATSIPVLAVLFPEYLPLGVLFVLGSAAASFTSYYRPEPFVFLALGTNFLKSAYIPGLVLGGEFGVTPTMLFTTLGFFGLSLQILMRRRPLVVPPGISFLLIYFTFTSLSLFIVTDARLASGSYVRTLLDWMLFFSLIQIVDSRRQFKKLIQVLLTQAVIVVLWGILSGIELERTGATFSMVFFWRQFQKNDFAAYLGFVLVFALATFILSGSRGQKITAFGLMLAVPVGWVFTFSRGGFVAIVACLALFLALERNKALLRRAFVLTSVLLICGVALVSLAPANARALAIDGLQSIFTGESVAERHTDTVEFRFQLIDSSLDVISERPILGVGFNHWQLYSPLQTYVLDPQSGEFRLTGYSIHNKYLLIAANSGLIALFGYLSFLTILVWAALYRSRRAIDSWIRTYLHVFLASTVAIQVALQFAPTVVWEWPLFGILAALIYLVEIENKASSAVAN